VAVKLHYPVAHVEAGLRSFDEAMPEEINRRLCDHISTYLYTTSRDADENLQREGIPAERIVFAGNTMIDTLTRLRDAAQARGAAAHLGLEPHGYVVATLHRPENVDEPASLRRLLDALAEVGRRLPVVFPAHPRTRERIRALDLPAHDESRALILSPPLGYLDFLGLVTDARLVLTDSGGVQEETTVLGVPCLTVRMSTERPVTVTSGTNKVIGTDPERLVAEAVAALAAPRLPRRLPERWDGRAGERIASHLGAVLRESSPVASTGP
jgi:UDP-N-acetylglucosamine 2-epimerase (non-hydrolysing)